MLFNNETFQASYSQDDIDRLNKMASDATVKNSNSFFTPSFKGNCVTAARVGVCVGCFAAGYIVVTGAVAWGTKKIFGSGE